MQFFPRMSLRSGREDKLALALRMKYVKSASRGGMNRIKDGMSGCGCA